MESVLWRLVGERAGAGEITRTVLALPKLGVLPVARLSRNQLNRISLA
jgi:hypothetical protein